MSANDLAEVIRRLRALRARYTAAGKHMEAKGVERAIEIACDSQMDPPDQARLADQQTTGHGSGVDPGSWLLGRFMRST